MIIMICENTRIDTILQEYLKKLIQQGFVKLIQQLLLSIT